MPASDPPVALDELLAHRAWVRSLALALARDEHEAADVEQATWVAAIESPPTHRSSLRGWLGTTARHALSRLRRGERRRFAHESAAPARNAIDDASDAADLAARADTHRRVVEALVALDEPYRRTLLLRYFEGLAVAEVAVRTGVPLETCRARLRRGIAKLRTRLEGEFGGRAAFAVALVWLGRGDGAGSAGASATAGTVAGGIVMGAKVWAAAAAALLVIGGVWWTTRTPDAAPPVVARTGTVAAPPRAARPVERASPPRAAPPVETPPPEPTKPAAPALPKEPASERTAQEKLDATRISASWSNVPCIDVLGEISARAGVDIYVDRATFERLSKPGPRTTMEFENAPAETMLGAVVGVASLAHVVQARRIVLFAAGGAAADDASLVRVPTTRTGPDGKPERLVFVVLDEHGVVVDGAEVWITAPPERRATTNAAGEATIDRPLASPEWFARKAGLVDSPAVTAADGGRLELRLGAAAARIEGAVRSRRGDPISGARLMLVATAAKPTAGFVGPHTPTTGDDGRFADASVPPGPTRVHASAEGFARASQDVELVAGRTATVDIVLPPESVCTGTVRNAKGDPVAGVMLQSITPDGRATSPLAMTAKDGTFRIGGLSAGKLALSIGGRRGPKLATTTLDLAEGETATWDPVIDPAAK